MKKYTAQSLILIFALTVYSYGQTNVWKNLKPLYSTRADAEKMLGKTIDERCLLGCNYETKDDFVTIVYADEKCFGSGWNVASGTILNVSVSSALNSGKSFDELNLDKKKLNLTVDDASYGTWTNAEDGLQYYFNNVENELRNIKYIPKRSDRDLRCDGFPPFKPEGNHYTMDVYEFYNEKLGEKQSLDRAFERTDSLIANVQSNKVKYKGYILVYFDDRLSFVKYRKRFKRLKKFLYKLRGAAPDAITIIEGGMRSRSEIEFYMLPKDYEPPAPEPTLPSPQFMKNRRR